MCLQIHQVLFLRGLSLVGWYHSHPHSPAVPSLQDIDAQMEYQLRLQGSSNGFQPCLALLCCETPAGNLVGGLTLSDSLSPPVSTSLSLQPRTILATQAPSPRSALSG